VRKPFAITAKVYYLCLTHEQNDMQKSVPVVAAIHKIVHGWHDLPAGGDTNNNNHSAKSPLPM
jgi:hypothetical protein